MKRLRGWRLSLLPLALALVLVAGSCARKEEQSVTTEERSQYETDSERRLAAVRAGIDSFRVELQVRADTTKADLQRDLDALEVARQDAARRLDELRAATAERWSEIRDELSDSMSDLEARMDTLWVRLPG